MRRRTRGWVGPTAWSGAWRWSPDPQTLERALALAQQAVALDDSLPYAHSLLGLVYAEKQQYDQASPKASGPSPSIPTMLTAMLDLGDMLNFAGRPEEALGWWSRRCGSTPAIQPPT